MESETPVRLEEITNDNRYCHTVKPILRLLPLFLASLWADEATDRVAIEKVIAALNEPRSGAGAKPLSTLFTSDADTSELDRLSNINRRLLDVSNKPWSEMTAPRIVSKSIRFVTPEVALVDSANAQYGSVVLVESIPVLLVMKKQGTDWRIASLRVLVNCMGIAQP
jgi:hypothetical protein